MKDARIDLILDDKTKELLSNIAKENNKTESKVLNQLIQNILIKNSKGLKIK